MTTAPTAPTAAPAEGLILPEEVTGIQYRTATIEDLDVARGTIKVRITPYEREARIGESTWETFERGAFAAAAKAPHRVKMWHLHTGPLIGHALSITDREDGCWAEGQFSNTVAAQEARELARDGTLDQVSVTFNPHKEWMRVARRPDGFHVTHTKAHMLGFALVPHGAYDDGGFVAEVRDAEARDAEERAQAEHQHQAEELERQRLERIAALKAMTH